MTDGARVVKSAVSTRSDSHLPFGYDNAPPSECGCAGQAAAAATVLLLFMVFFSTLKL